jgi:hypothetical protein
MPARLRCRHHLRPFLSSAQPPSPRLRATSRTKERHQGGSEYHARGSGEILMPSSSFVCVSRMKLSGCSGVHCVASAAAAMKMVHVADWKVLCWMGYESKTVGNEDIIVVCRDTSNKVSLTTTPADVHIEGCQPIYSAWWRFWYVPGASLLALWHEQQVTEPLLYEACTSRRGIRLYRT